MNKLSSDYAKTIAVNEADGHTAHGVYLTTADIKHIRKMLSRMNDLASGRVIMLDRTAFEWNKEILDYTRGVR